MYNRDELRERATLVKDKKATIGPDINLEEFDAASVSHSYLTDEDMCQLPEEEQQRLIMAGLDVRQKNRGGTYFQKDTSVIHCHSQQEGIEVIPIRKALEDKVGKEEIMKESHPGMPLFRQRWSAAECAQYYHC